MGLILAAVAVQFVTDGLRELLPAWLLMGNLRSADGIHRLLQNIGREA